MGESKGGCSEEGWSEGCMNGVDDTSLDGAELDLDGAEQLLPRQEKSSEVVV